MPAHRLVKRVYKAVVNSLLRTPIERLACVVLVTSIVAGVVTLLEPGFTLRFRRGVRPWKVAPYLCGAPWFTSLADMLHRLQEIPTVGCVLMMARILSRWLFFPLVTFLTAVSNPVIARSVIVLVSFPTSLLALSCRVPKLLAAPGLNALLTWVTTTVIMCLTQLRSPDLLRWAISDVSLTLYLAVLAAVLAVVSVQERLAIPSARNNQDTKKKINTRSISRRACNDLVVRCMVYLFAAVLSVWIITASDTTLAASKVLQDVDRMVYRRGPLPWECS